MSNVYFLKGINITSITLNNIYQDGEVKDNGNQASYDANRSSVGYANLTGREWYALIGIDLKSIAFNNIYVTSATLFFYIDSASGDPTVCNPIYIDHVDFNTNVDSLDATNIICYESNFISYNYTTTDIWYSIPVAPQVQYDINHAKPWSLDNSSNWFQIRQRPVSNENHTTYDYANIIAADNGTVEQHPYLKVYYAILPEIPNVQVALITNDYSALSIKWDDADNETSYTLFRSTVNDTNFATNIIGLTENTTNYIDQNVTVGTTYYYWVKSYQEEGYSAGYSLVASNTPQPPSSVPLEPSPVLSYYSGEKVFIEWNNVANESSYTLFRSTSNDTNSATVIGGVGENLTNYIDASSSLGVTNYYWIKAYNLLGSSGFSSVTFTCLYKPEIPDGITGGFANTIECSNYIENCKYYLNIVIKWDDVSTETSYTLFRSSVNNISTATAIAGLGENQTIYTDFDLMTNQYYYYWVKAYNSIGESGESTVLEMISDNIFPHGDPFEEDYTVKDFPGITNSGITVPYSGGEVVHIIIKTNIIRNINPGLFGLNVTVEKDEDMLDETSKERIRRIKSRFLRWWAGNTYFWNEDYPPYAISQGWNKWTNSFYVDIDEHFRYAEELGFSVKQITLNYGYRQYYTTLYDGNLTNAIKLAADLVEYCNSPNDGSNPNGGIDWAAVRASRGHPEPYNVKYWEVGNEVNGDWYTDEGGSEPDGNIYGSQAALFMDAMKAVDPSIHIGVFCDPRLKYYNWSKDVLTAPGLADRVDYVVYHHFGGLLFDDTVEKDTSITPQETIEDADSWIIRKLRWDNLIKEFVPNRASDIRFSVSAFNLGKDGYSDPVEVTGAITLAKIYGYMLETGYNDASIHTPFGGWDYFKVPGEQGTFSLINQKAGGVNTNVPPFMPYPEYYITWMFNAKFGDQLIESSSDNSKIFVFASRFNNDNSKLGVIIINEDSVNYTAELNLQGEANIWVLTGDDLTNTDISLNGEKSGYQWGGPTNVDAVVPYYELFTNTSAFTLHIEKYSVTAMLINTKKVETVSWLPSPSWIRAAGSNPPSAPYIEIKWEKIPNVTSYTLFKSTENNTNSAVAIAGISAESNSYKDYSVKTGVKYFYWVKAYNSTSETPFCVVDWPASAMVGEVNRTIIMYVDKNSTGCEKPYDTVSSAATNIQIAVDYIYTNNGLSSSLKKNNNNVIIYVLNGRYNEQVYIDRYSTSEENDIKIVNYPGHSPVIVSNNIYINDDYITIKGIKIDLYSNPGYDTGIDVRGSFVTIRSCQIGNTAKGGDSLYGNIYIGSSSTGCKIENNFLYNMTNGSGIQSRSSNVLITGNKCYNNQDGIDIRNCNYGGIYNNIVYNNTRDGIRLNASVVDMNNWEIINNTVYNNGQDGISFEGTNSFNNIILLNNLVTYNDAIGVNAEAAVSFSRVNFNNVWSNTGGNENIGTGWGGDNLSSDPQYISTEVNNTNFLQISSSSICIDRGTNVINFGITNDFWGDIRPFDADGINNYVSAFDIGADEYYKYYSIVIISISKSVTNISNQRTPYSAIPGAKISYTLIVSNQATNTIYNAFIYEAVASNVSYFTDYKLSGITAWTSEYSTNKFPDQSYTSADYSRIRPAKNKIKWVRWIAPEVGSKEKSSLVFEIIIK